MQQLNFSPNVVYANVPAADELGFDEQVEYASTRVEADYQSYKKPDDELHTYTTLQQATTATTVKSLIQQLEGRLKSESDL